MSDVIVVFDANSYEKMKHIVGKYEEHKRKMREKSRNKDKSEKLYSINSDVKWKVLNLNEIIVQGGVKSN